MGMGNWQTVARDQKEWRRIVLEVKVCSVGGGKEKSLKSRVSLSTS
jgi:hypothetical protein